MHGQRCHSAPQPSRLQGQHQTQSVLHFVELERRYVPHQPVQAPPIESDQLRYVDHGIMIEAAGALGQVYVAWRRAQSEVAGDRNSDDRADPASIEPIRLNDDDGSMKSRL